MALPNIFGQNVKPLQAINAQNNAQVANKNPEQIAQVPVSIFGASHRRTISEPEHRKSLRFKNAQAEQSCITNNKKKSN